MNILPFVFALLVLMAITAGSLSRDIRSTAQEKKVIEGYLAADRKIRNQRESSHYSSVAKSEPKKKGETPPPKKPSKEAVFDSHRDEKNYSEGSKFVLNSAPHLREPALKLLRILYGKASFYQKGLEEQILDAILSAEGDTLAERFPQDPALAEAYYHMLKGTNIYDTSTHEGYPPLSDFFILGKDGDKIHFKEANRFVLISILGAELTEKVIAKEKERWLEDKKTKKRLNKPLFVELVEKEKGFDLNLIDTYFSFGKTGKKNNTVAVDAPSGITARR